MQNILFLHGALGSASHWQAVLAHLKGEYRIHTLTFPSHGSNRETLAVNTQESLAEFVAGYIRNQGLNEVILIGYSLGGYIGLRLVSDDTLPVKGIITLATKLAWDTTIAGNEAEKLSELNLQAIAAKLESEHGSDWQRLIPVTKEILISIGKKPLNTNDASSIQIPLYMLVGEKDKMVTPEETESFSLAAPNAQFKVLPGQPHLLEKMNAENLAIEIENCLNSMR